MAVIAACIGLAPMTTAGAVAPPPPARATFGLGPANSRGLDGRSYLNYAVTPGATLTDDVAVVNDGDAPVTLRLYPVDSVATGDGTAALAPGDQAATDVGSWVVVEGAGQSGTVTVPSRGDVVVPIAVAVPRDARPGDHFGGIVAALTGVARNPQGELVHVDQRVAVRAYFRVAGDLLPKLSVDGLSAVYHHSYNVVGDGNVTISYRVRNTGNVRLAAKQRVRFRGLFGKTRASSALADVPVLLPGASVTYTVRIADVPPAVLGTAHVDLTPYAPPGDVDPRFPRFGASHRIWTLPVALTVAFVALMLGGGVARVLSVRRRAA